MEITINVITTTTKNEKIFFLYTGIIGLSPHLTISELKEMLQFNSLKFRNKKSSTKFSSVKTYNIIQKEF